MSLTLFKLAFCNLYTFQINNFQAMNDVENLISENLHHNFIEDQQ